MRVELFLDYFLPGDEHLKIPCFSKCDKPKIIEKFITTLPVSNLNKIDINFFKNSDFEIIIKNLKKQNIDIDTMLELSLIFYFSRSLVVKPLTGRDLPYFKIQQ